MSLLSILKDSGKAVLLDRASADLTADEKESSHCHSGMTSSRAGKKYQLNHIYTVFELEKQLVYHNKTIANYLY